jgi:integrase
MTSKRDHGDGGIDQRGENRWRLRYRVNGKRYAKSFHGTLTDARRQLRRLLNSADDGAHVAPARLTLKAWSEQWLALQERKVTARSLEKYAYVLAHSILPSLGDRPVQQITPADLDALCVRLQQTGISPRTVRHAHSILAACLKAAVRKDILVVNPADRADPPRVKATEVGRVLDQEELSALLAGFRGLSLYPLVATAAFTGGRRNELLALRWSDVDLAAKALTVARALENTKAHGLRFKEPKTARGRRTIAIDDGLTDLLRAERERHLRIVAGIADGTPVDLSLVKLPDDALVFPSLPDVTKPRHPHSVTNAFVQRVRKIGFGGLRFHDLRGTHETLLLDAGIPIHVVAARCGHDPAVLLRAYAKLTKKADASAAALIGALSKGMLGG